MTTQHNSPREIEREVEASRAQLASTLGRIEKKLSPGALLDDALSHFKNSEAANGVGEFGRNFARSVRDNPIPVTIAAAGLGWLLWSSARTPRHANNVPHPVADSTANVPPNDGDAAEATTVNDRTSKARETVSDAARAGRDKASTVASTVKESVGQAGDEIRNAVGAARDGAHETVESARDQLHAATQKVRASAANTRDHVVQAGSRVKGVYETTLEERPLALAAVGFAVGAALGAALPRTAREDAIVGAHSDAIKDQAKQTAQQQLQNAEEIATAAYSAAQQEAENQGLTRQNANSARETAKEKSSMSPTPP